MYWNTEQLPPLEGQLSLPRASCAESDFCCIMLPNAEWSDLLGPSLSMNVTVPEPVE